MSSNTLEYSKLFDKLSFILNGDIKLRYQRRFGSTAKWISYSDVHVYV